MRNFTFSILSLALVAGCGPGAMKADGGDLGNPIDMTNGDAGDMPPAVAEGCGGIYNCLGQNKTLAQYTAHSPAEAVQKLRDFFNCVNDTCGFGNDASPTQACAADMAGLGCTTCENNTLAGPNSFFGDAMGNPLMCMPTNAPECGVCLPAATTCIFNDCYSDVDCMGLTHSDGTMATCNLSAGTPGMCM